MWRMTNKVEEGSVARASLPVSSLTANENEKRRKMKIRGNGVGGSRLIKEK